MRYAQPTTLGPGGYSYDTSIPEVPSLPQGLGLPIMGEGFSNDQDETKYGAHPALNMQAYGQDFSHSNNYQSASTSQRPSDDFQYGYVEEDDGSGSGRPRVSGESARSFGSGSAVGLEAYGRDPAIDLKALSGEKFDAQNCEY